MNATEAGAEFRRETAPKSSVHVATATPFPATGRARAIAQPRLMTALALVSALLLFAGAVAWHIELPGLYMDAVNPDYLVVDLLHGPAPDQPIWILPGNLLGGRVPLLTSLYHGTLNMWLALPFVALWGTGVGTLRAAQATAGAAILILAFLFARADRTPRSQLLAWLAIVGLAIDPVFIYSFRTQLYIQLCPTAFLLAALVAGRRGLCAHSRTGAEIPYRPAWLLVAGICYGLSIFGYFIFGFFAPALIAGALLAGDNRSGRAATNRTRTKILAWLAAGLVVGLIGYIVGALEVLQAENGFDGFVSFFARYQQSLGAFEHHRSWFECLGYFANLIWRVFSNDWQRGLMFEDPRPDPGSVLKMLLLWAVPIVLWFSSELRGRPSPRLRLVLGLLVSFPLVGLVFGDRLAGHHFIVLLPLAYLALAIALADAAPSLRRIAPGVWILLAIVNLIGLRSIDAELLQTRGRGLFSDAINRLASDALAAEAPQHRQLFYFPDWGLFMSFHFLTNGAIRHAIDIDVDAIRHELCAGQSVNVALITGDVDKRFRDLASRLATSPPQVRPYLSHEGQIVFTVGTFAAFAPGIKDEPACHTANQN